MTQVLIVECGILGRKVVAEFIDYVAEPNEQTLTDMLRRRKIQSV